jgi:hypothetical protein
MKLWQLLVAICFVFPIGTALGPARAADVGIRGYVLAIATGLAVGACCSWIMWRTHKAVIPKLLRRLEERRSLAEWYGRAFYVSKVVWIAFAGSLAFWLSWTLLRRVF